MHWVEIFDIAHPNDYAKWWFGALGISLLLIASLWLALPKRQARIRRVVGGVIAVIVAVGAVVFVAAIHRQYEQLQAIRASGAFTVVTGPVVHFRHAKLDSFDVRGVYFEYGSTQASAAYSDNGGFFGRGPVQDGANIRIAYVNDPKWPGNHLILRLEIASNG